MVYYWPFCPGQACMHAPSEGALGSASTTPFLLTTCGLGKHCLAVGEYLSYMYRYTSSLQLYCQNVPTPRVSPTNRDRSQPLPSQKSYVPPSAPPARATTQIVPTKENECWVTLSFVCVYKSVCSTIRFVFVLWQKQMQRQSGRKISKHPPRHVSKTKNLDIWFRNPFRQLLYRFVVFLRVVFFCVCCMLFCYLSRGS